MTKSNVHFIADETLGHGVQIDGKRYKLVERIAEVGEKVLHYFEGESDGLVKTVNTVGATSVEIDEYLDNDGDTVTGYVHGNYYVLVPIKSEWQRLLEGENYPESEESLVTVDATQCSEAVLGMLANLACRVTELESQLKSPSPWATQEDVIELNGRVEMCIDDIITLDERTQPLVEPKQAAEALLRKIAKLIEEEGGGI